MAQLDMWGGRLTVSMLPLVALLGLKYPACGSGFMRDVL